MLSLRFSMIALTLERTGLSGTVDAGAADTEGAKIESRECAGLEMEELVA